jgi:hypothetical protein
MARVIEQDGKRYFLDGYKFIEIPNTRDKAYFKGKMFDVRDRVDDFMKSDLTSCIIPVYCSGVFEKKAFKKVTLITREEEYEFMSSEKGQYSYYRNEIKEIEKGGAYFIFLEKFARARNDCLIKAVMKIEK